MYAANTAFEAKAKDACPQVDNLSASVINLLTWVKNFTARAGKLFTAVKNFITPDGKFFTGVMSFLTTVNKFLTRVKKFLTPPGKFTPHWAAGNVRHITAIEKFLLICVTEDGRRKTEDLIPAYHNFFLFSSGFFCLQVQSHRLHSLYQSTRIVSNENLPLWYQT